MVVTVLFFLLAALALSASVREIDPDLRACDMATGRDSVWCGYQCYNGPSYGDRLNDCTCSNCCGPDCWTWDQSFAYMNNNTCDTSTQYLLTLAKQAGDRSSCNVGGPCSWTSVFGECANLTVCDLRYQYESAFPTLTTNRRCNLLTNCTTTEYQTVAPTSTTDRSCTNLTVCDSSEYQTVAPTPTTDRVCANLTECKLGPEIIPPTPTSDRECDVERHCPPPQWVVKPPTDTTSVVCSGLAASMSLSVIGGSSLMFLIIFGVVLVYRRKLHLHNQCVVCNNADEENDPLVAEADSVRRTPVSPPGYHTFNNPAAIISPTESDQPICLSCQAVFKGCEGFCMVCGTRRGNEAPGTSE